MLRAFASLSRSCTGRARDERPGSPTAAPPRWGPEVLYPYASPPHAQVKPRGYRTTVTLPSYWPSHWPRGTRPVLETSGLRCGHEVRDRYPADLRRRFVLPRRLQVLLRPG